MDLRDEDGDTPLMEAAYRGWREVAKMLSDRGVSVNLSSRFGNTALIEAVSSWRIHVVELLLRRGAAVGTVNDRGMTALAYANVMGYEDIATALRAHDAA